MKTIGIIGGAGPMASCRLYQLVIEQCHQNYGCSTDADFPCIKIYSYPFADMITIGDSQSNRVLLARQLQECIDQLTTQNVRVMGIACNTLHTLLPDVVLSPTTNFIHIARATLAYAHKSGIKRLLILATGTTINQQLYQSPDIECISPSTDDQNIVNNVIENVTAGNITEQDSSQLSTIVNKHNLDGVVLGCTELPLLHDRYPIQTKEHIKVFDTLRTLAAEIVREAFKQPKL